MKPADPIRELPMYAILRRAALLGTALALAGCATNGGLPPTQVTRFHLGQPIAPAEVAVEPRERGAAQSLEFDTYARAISAELTRNGFRPAANLATSELVAVLDIDRNLREGPPSSSGLSIGLGGGGFSGGRRGGGIGLGGGVSFPVGKRRSNDLVTSEISVQLKRRSDGTVIWEGRARTAARAGTPPAQVNAAAVRLAAALFQNFPGESGKMVEVK
jgi:hypothetical protein